MSRCWWSSDSKADKVALDEDHFSELRVVGLNLEADELSAFPFPVESIAETRHVLSHNEWIS